MPLSTVFHLKALERGSIPQYMGAAVMSEFLSWMGITDSEEPHSEEADEMHGGSKLRPYTISDLRGDFRAHRGFHLVEPGQTAWFRATTLKQQQTDILRKKVLPTIEGRVLKLGGVKFQVQKLAQAGKHPWAREVSYESLVEQYFKSERLPPDVLEIQFVSLTTFHAGLGVYTPLPIPRSVFLSWLQRWNAFSSTSLPNAADEVFEAKLALSWYEINPTTIKYKQYPWIGYTGTCRFRVFSKDEFWVRLCNLLADYSFFCGTGHKPTFGLGQTKRLNEMDRKNPGP